MSAAAVSHPEVRGVKRLVTTIFSTCVRKGEGVLGGHFALSEHDGAFASNTRHAIGSVRRGVRGAIESQLDLEAVLPGIGRPYALSSHVLTVTKEVSAVGQEDRNHNGSGGTRGDIEFTKVRLTEIQQMFFLHLLHVVAQMLKVIARVALLSGRHKPDGLDDVERGEVLEVGGVGRELNLQKALLQHPQGLREIDREVLGSVVQNGVQFLFSPFAQKVRADSSKFPRHKAISHDGSRRERTLKIP